MSHDIGVKARWLKLSEALDASWSSLHDVGGALGRLMALGLKSTDFPEPRTLEELIERRDAASRGMTDEEYDSLSPHQQMVKLWWDHLDRSQRALARAERDLREEIAVIPADVVSLLDALHRRPWRPHFRRFYLDSLRELPAPIRDFDMAFYDEDGIPDVYVRTTIPTSLKMLLIRAEVYSPFEHWYRLIRRGQRYAADIHAIRDEIGMELPDGPHADFRWRRDGKLIEDRMPPSAWKLANFMWRRHRQPARFAECAEPVFGDRNEEVDENRIGSHRRNANNYFKANSIPWKIETKQGLVTMKSFEWAGGHDSSETDIEDHAENS